MRTRSGCLTLCSGYRVEGTHDQRVLIIARPLLGLCTSEDRDVGTAFRIGIFDAPLIVPGNTRVLLEDFDFIIHFHVSFNRSRHVQVRSGSALVIWFPFFYAASCRA